MAVSLSFPTPPEVPLWKALTHRPGALPAGGSIPAIEARADRLGGDPAAYARVCGFPAVDPLPVTWPAVAARGLQMAVMTHPAFPLPVPGIVHVRQQIRWTRPLGASEALSVAVRVEGHRVVRLGGEFDLETEVRDGAGVVWSAVTTILSKALPGDGQKRPRPQDVPFPSARSTRWRLPADQGRRYAAVSGDWNPIHLHPLSARLFGFKRPIMHGWWLLARALAELDEDVPAAGSLDVRFVSPVPLPGTVGFRSGPASGGLRFELGGPRGPCLVGEVRGQGDLSPILHRCDRA